MTPEERADAFLASNPRTAGDEWGAIVATIRAALEEERDELAAAFENRTAELNDSARQDPNRDLLMGEADGVSWCRDFVLNRGKRGELE